MNAAEEFSADWQLPLRLRSSELTSNTTYIATERPCMGRDGVCSFCVEGRRDCACQDTCVCKHAVMYSISDKEFCETGLELCVCVCVGAHT